MVLLEAWKAFEAEHGDEQSQEDVQAKMPRVVKKRRELEDGSGGMEEVSKLLLPYCNSSQMLTLNRNDLHSTTTCFSPTTRKRANRLSSSSRWHMRGAQHRLQKNSKRHPRTRTRTKSSLASVHKQYHAHYTHKHAALRYG